MWLNRIRIDYKSMQNNSMQQFDNNTTGQDTKRHDTEQYNCKFERIIRMIALIKLNIAQISTNLSPFAFISCDKRTPIIFAADCGVIVWNKERKHMYVRSQIRTCTCNNSCENGKNWLKIILQMNVNCEKNTEKIHTMRRG